MSQMKPTLREILDNPTLMDSMTLGDLLAATGVVIEVEKAGATAEENARLSKLLSESSYMPDRKRQ